MAGDGAVLDLGRTDMDALHVRNLAAPIGATTTWFARLVVMTQTGDQLTFELAAGVQINGVVDGLAGHGAFRIVGPKKA